MLNDLGGLKDCFFEELTNLGAGSRRFKSSRPDHLISNTYTIPKILILILVVTLCSGFF